MTPTAARFTGNRLCAAASIEAAAGPGGATRLPVLASQAPLVLRRTPAAVYLVGGAAGPLGGDSLALRITVGAGAFLRVRTAAAAIALPGLDGLESVLRVSVTVAARRAARVPAGAGRRHGGGPARDARVGGARGRRLAGAPRRDLLGRHGEAGGTGPVGAAGFLRGTAPAAAVSSRSRAPTRPASGPPCWPGTGRSAPAARGSSRSSALPARRRARWRRCTVQGGARGIQVAALAGRRGRRSRRHDRSPVPGCPRWTARAQRLAG